MSKSGPLPFWPSHPKRLRIWSGVYQQVRFTPNSVVKLDKPQDLKFCQIPSWLRVAIIFLCALCRAPCSEKPAWRISPQPDLSKNGKRDRVGRRSQQVDATLYLERKDGGFVMGRRLHRGFTAAERAEIFGIPENIPQTTLIPVAYYTGEDFHPARRTPAQNKTSWNVWGASRE